MNAYKDALGRTVTYTDGNGKLVKTVYSLNDVQTTTGPPPTGENAKVVQVEYDGLGRIKSTCALETSGGTACGQAMGGSGILTSYTYAYSTGTVTVTATRGSEVKTTVTDALGRVLSLQTPEETAAYTYAYDSTTSSSPCGAVTSKGDLISENVAGMYTRCYKHDLLHRVTDITTTLSAPAGYCRRFRYDNSLGVLGALPSGVALANNLGRLVEAETDTCAQPITSASIITDEWFSYDKNGRKAATRELTPTQSTYYASSVTYFLNGLPNVLTIPGYSITYGLNANGRWSTAMRSTTTWVSGVTYGPLGPTEVAIGSGTDADEYVYDPNTGNMKQYQFFVGSTASYKGVLSWNPIGSLGSAAITDGFNSGNTQTCTYTHDDVARLTGDSCGSNWAQTFSYDQYNNLTKAGSAAFNPGYNTKNQYTGLGATYDAAGNLTYDGTNTIVWDAFGKMMSFGGTTFVYDAFGNAVRNAAGKDILYGPLGKIGVITHPSSYGNTYIPLPGGSSVFSMSNGHYAHRDFLGTSAVVSTVPVSGDGTVASDVMYAPYGDQYDSHGTVSPVMFAGNPSDLNGSLYDTPNRELSVVGRWESVDPAHASWNGYAYVTDPTVQTDNSGLIGYVYNNGALGGGLCDGPICDATGVDMQSLWNGGAGLGGCGVNRSCAHPPAPQSHSLHTICPNGVTVIHTQAVARANTIAPPIIIVPPLTRVLPAIEEIVESVLARAAVPLLALDYLIDPNQGKVGIDSTDQLPVPTQESISTPFRGTPGDTVTSRRPDGTVVQVRRYGPDGFPDTDVDYSHSHDGAPIPHAHDWGRPSDGADPTHLDRGPWRDPQPDDPQPN